MFPASTKGGGQCMAFPDVCKVPAPPAPFVPVPFPNIAMLPQGNGGTMSSKVKIGNQPAATKDTEIPMSSGDEAGTLGGMISGQFKGACKFKSGSSKVKWEGKAAVHVTSPIGQNGSNANAPGGMQVAPSQVKVLVAG
jgi:hypothetical protein